MMVVVPTDNDVSLTYDVTPVDWLGRVLTVLGLAGLVLLARWKSARKHAAGTVEEPFDDTAAAADDASDGEGDEPAPPDRPGGRRHDPEGEGPASCRRRCPIRARRGRQPPGALACIETAERAVLTGGSFHI